MEDAKRLRTIGPSPGPRVNSVRIYVALIVAGALARLAVAVLTTNSSDLALFAYFVQQGASGHPLYADPAGYSYPPLVGYCWIAAGKILAALGQPPLVHFASLSPYRVGGLVSDDLTPPLSSLLIKLPALVSDAAAAWGIDLACRRCGAVDERRRIAVLAFWLNPLTIFNSAVQASWDSAVGVSVIAACAAAYERKALGAGAWVAAGAFAKLVPSVCAPLSVIALLKRCAPGARAAAASLFGWAAGAALVCVMALAPAAAWHELLDVRGSLAARAGGAAVFGAFNAWQLASVTSFAPFAHWLAANGTTVAHVLLFAQIGGVLAVAAVYARRREPGLEETLIAALATLAIVVLTIAYVQPGYAVWLLPPCCVLFALRPLPWGGCIAVLSAAAFGFVLAIRAPSALAMPACVFFHLCDATASAQAAFSYAFAPGVLTPLLQIDRDTLFGVIGSAAVLAVAGSCIAVWRRPVGRHV